ncbi:terminase [Candidatus Merdisoma sp. JLR.KK011]|jgi:DNA-directed RNA polymerase specialized sigma subunit|uniref:terminase n=1 Tax=Candidatus Merdisoma sp. JLR.KK011 TaxID=3114299 RepID=UPI002FF419EE
MGNNLVKKGINVIQMLENFVAQTELENVKTTLNTKTGTASITGSKDGYQYTTTMQKETHGMVRTESMFECNLGKEALISQVKNLRRQGYKQQEIADMLGISQSLVSKYSRM